MTEQNRLDLSTHLQRLAPKTQRLYTRWIQRYLGDTYQVEADRFQLTEIRPEIITSALEPARLQDWLHMLHKRDLSGATIVQARSAIVWLAGALTSSAHLHAYQAGALSLVKPPIQPERNDQQWLSPAQSRKLLEALHCQDQPPAIRARNIAIITVMLTCGLRREEIIEARWSDIEGERLKVRGKGGKTRYAPLPGIAAEALHAWRQYHPMPYGEHYIFTRIGRNGIVTTEPLSGQSITDIVKDAGLLAGLDVSPHDLRRTFAQNAFDMGVDLEVLADMLGHESLGTTQVYLKEMQRSAGSPATPSKGASHPLEQKPK